MVTQICTTKTKRGNIVLGHGLNLNPDKLREMASWFNDHGFDVHVLRFPGHTIGEPSDPFSIEASTLALKATTDPLQGDFYFCGFSISCLVYAVAVKEKMIEEGKGNIFISPAFKPTLMIELSNLMPDWLYIPSYRYQDYQIHKGLNAKIYKNVKKHSNSFNLLPFTNTSLVIMDKGDLALNVEKILLLVQNYEQEIFEYRQTPSPRHMLVDRHTVGESNWDRFGQRILRFLGVYSEK